MVSESDAWESSVYVRKHHLIGDVQFFVLDCYEDDVVWDSSAAKLFQAFALTGDAVRLWLVEPPRTLDIQVFIMDIKVEYNLGSPNHRKFVVTVKEDMN